MKSLRQPGVLRGDLRAPGGQELTDFGTVVQLNDITAGTVGLGCSISTSINRDFPVGCSADLLKDMTTTFRSRRAGVVLAAALLFIVLAG